MNARAPWSRRRFLGAASVGGGAFAIAAVAPALSHPLSRPAIEGLLAPAGLDPVLSFHLDQPYIDMSGGAHVYRWPAGARGGAPVAELSDVELSRYYGVI